jgi:hypothetical protein
MSLQYVNSGAVLGQNFSADQGFNSSYVAGVNSDALGERSQALTLIVDIWKLKPDFMQARQTLSPLDFKQNSPLRPSNLKYTKETTKNG